MRGKLGVAVAEDLVDRARHLAALDMGRADVVGGADQRAGQRLDPVAMHDDQIGPVLGDEIGKADDGLGQDQVLRIALGAGSGTRRRRRRASARTSSLVRP